MSLSVGDAAPEFTLKDTDGSEVTLSSFRDRQSVTLVFIPFAFSGTCQGELCELRDHLNTFTSKENQLLVITCDSRHSLKRWKEEQSYNFPLLSDFWPHGAVATAYGCFNDTLGCAMRQTVVIGKDGIVVESFASGGLGEARDLDSYSGALTKV